MQIVAFVSRGAYMTVKLNHTIVHAHDQRASAEPSRAI